jgi:hypothetical protein
VPNPIYPTLPSGSLPDSRQFSQALEDPAMRTEMEGGYVSTRPKHTRTPRKTWSVAYQMLTDADKTELETFWNTVKGGSVIFDWTNPANDVVYQVRFKEPLNFQYKGIAYTRRWDCSFSVEQA